MNVKRILCAAAVLLVATVVVGGMTRAADEDKPKYTIKQVMKTAMKGGLCKKVASGEASADEQKQLVEMFVALAANKPPKGDAESWKTKTTALVSAAKAVAAGDDGGVAALGKAANCMACHKVHKGS